MWTLGFASISYRFCFSCGTTWNNSIEFHHNMCFALQQGLGDVKKQILIFEDASEIYEDPVQNVNIK